MPIRIIIFKNNKYLDFSTIYLLCGNNFARTSLWRYLRKNKKIKNFIVKSERIYNLNDLLSDSFIVQNLMYPEILSQALEED